ncbi:hypothetical protein [Alloactinosynnema sp. L-07]|nr:hypothetical protein [Alloactinosynnema sp. L-07]
MAGGRPTSMPHRTGSPRAPHDAVLGKDPPSKRMERAHGKAGRSAVG